MVVDDVVEMCFRVCPHPAIDRKKVEQKFEVGKRHEILNHFFFELRDQVQQRNEVLETSFRLQEIRGSLSKVFVLYMQKA